MRPLRVLLITRECLRTDSNEGNVLLSLFAGQPVELANLYCKPGLPDTRACATYFQLTDRMALDNLLRRTPMGRRVEPELPAHQAAAQGEKENKAFYDFFRSHNLTLFHAARELLWKLADFKSQALRDFVTGFGPDVIFAPLCYSMFVLAVHRHVIGLAGAPAVTYAYDDLYSLRQFRFSPLFWAHRLLQRRAIRKTLPYYRYAYTMTRQQAEEYGLMLGLPMRVLRKCAAAQSAAGGADTAQDPASVPHQPRNDIRLIYGGGVYFGRDKILMAVSDGVRALRQEGWPVRMDVYTASPLSQKARRKLQDGEGCALHPAVPFAVLEKLYRESDIALHVESFQKKNALVTRLSFSTKIVDCLASGCAVLAICPPINAGWQYLRDEDAAVCVQTPKDIQKAVRRMLGDQALRQTYAHRARECLLRNHDEKRIRQSLLADLEGVARGEDQK